MLVGSQVRSPKPRKMVGIRLTNAMVRGDMHLTTRSHRADSELFSLMLVQIDIVFKPQSPPRTIVAGEVSRLFERSRPRPFHHDFPLECAIAIRHGLALSRFSKEVGVSSEVLGVSDVSESFPL